MAENGNARNSMDGIASASLTDPVVAAVGTGDGVHTVAEADHADDVVDVLCAGLRVDEKKQIQPAPARLKVDCV